MHLNGNEKITPDFSGVISGQQQNNSMELEGVKSAN